MGHIELKSLEQVKWMCKAELVVADVHRSLREVVRPGITTRELDVVSAQAIRRAGATSNFLNYAGYPATVCTSTNDVVVHGIPGDRTLEEGDLVSFGCDAWVSRNGREWHGDAAFSMTVGDEWIPDEEFAQGKRAMGTAPSGLSNERIRRRRELDAVTHESPWVALADPEGVRRVLAVGTAVEDMVALDAGELGWETGIIEEYTGHGTGTAMHQEPEILNYNARGISTELKPDMVLAVEPTLTAGGIETFTEDDEWTVRTCDGSDAAHWEHIVAILSEGISVLAVPGFGKAGLAPFGVIPIEL